MYGGGDQVTGVTRLTPGLAAEGVMPQFDVLAVHGEPGLTLAETVGAVVPVGYITTT